mgnify:CR=1 FL=1
MYLNDFIVNDFEGIDLDMFKLCLLLYADDIVIMSETEERLKHSLFVREKYSDIYKLTVNATKTKVMIFMKGGRVNRNIRFIYKENVLEIVSKFTYLGIIFTTGGYINTPFEILAGQALTAIYKLKSNLLKRPGITVQHKLDLFDKLILPFLNYGSEVWGLNDSTKLEGIHIHFCKHILGVRGQTQNNCVHGELGRTSLKSRRLVNICTIR